MKILYLPNEYSQQRQYDVRARIYPVLLAMEATYYKKLGHEVYWGSGPGIAFDKIITDPEGLPFLSLPFPDRLFTQTEEEIYQENGNYKYLPATYMQVSRDCWYHKCSFCRWAKRYPVCETRSVESAIAEIKECVSMGYREIFDDSGTFPVGKWLKDFCREMISTGLNKQVVLGCNMRFGALDIEDFWLMKEAGFRMILWGLESANQYTLDTLNKGIKVEEAVIDLVLANKAGLWNHVAVMFGYPWEDKAEEQNTFEFIREGLLHNKIKTAQASIYDVGYSAGIVGKNNYAAYFRRKVYRLYFHPVYIWHRIKEIRSVDDIEYYIRGVRKCLRKLLGF